MSPSLNNNGQSPASSSLPPPKPPAWGPSRNTPLPSSDSVFEDDDKTPDDNPRLQELMSQLKKVRRRRLSTSRNFFGFSLLVQLFVFSANFDSTTEFNAKNSD